MKIYLAARYHRHAEMRQVRDALAALGHQVTSTWIDQHGGTLPDSLTPDALNTRPDRCGRFAAVDLADLLAADTVISFTSEDGGGKGGRHVEFGLALGLGKRCLLVGPRENVFHTLPTVEHLPDRAALMTTLSRPGPARTAPPGCPSRGPAAPPADPARATPPTRTPEPRGSDPS